MTRSKLLGINLRQLSVAVSLCCWILTSVIDSLIFFEVLQCVRSLRETALNQTNVPLYFESFHHSDVKPDNIPPPCAAWLWSLVYFCVLNTQKKIFFCCSDNENLTKRSPYRYTAWYKHQRTGSSDSVSIKKKQKKTNSLFCWNFYFHFYFSLQSIHSFPLSVNLQVKLYPDIWTSVFVCFSRHFWFLTAM